MKNRRCLRHRSITALFLLTGIAAMTMTSCEDDVSEIGSGIRPSDVSINVDSTAFDLKGHSVEALSIDSRSTNTLLGSINTKEYGQLRCSYVTQLLPSENINLPDTITPADIDSVRLIMRVPRSTITGDTLSPQQATVYRLTQQLPTDISSSWSPDGKYSPSPMGHVNYTLSSLSMGQTANLSKNVLSIEIPMPKQMGEDALRQYREDPTLFLWPQDFAKKFPGLFVDATFGKGCIACVNSTNIYVYTHHQEPVSVFEDSVYVSKLKTIKDSTCFFTSAPEVISSNIIDFKPAENLKSRIASGDVIITTPGGFNASITFPAEEVLSEFRKNNYDLSIINNLSLSIPAEKISNSLGIDVPPSLLMIKKSEAESFFTENKIPDDESSFVLKWDAINGIYQVSSMRKYIVGIYDKETITEEDTTFMLIPVSIGTETIDNSDGTTTIVTTSCVPYLTKPTMVNLHTDRGVIVFTYSNQIIF